MEGIMKKALKKVIIFLVVATLLLGTIGCNKTETPTSVESQSESTTGTKQTESTGRGDKSIVFNVDWPTYIDPGVGSKGSDSIAFINLYDTLTFPNSDGTVRPHVAESWTTNDDSTIYTFILRDDVYFHSGNKLTANDVKSINSWRRVCIRIFRYNKGNKGYR
jgi:peptide/nickel transport system substrate-binding protein